MVLGSRIGWYNDQINQMLPEFKKIRWMVPTLTDTNRDLSVQDVYYCLIKFYNSRSELQRLMRETLILVFKFHPKSITKKELMDLTKIGSELLKHYS